MTKTEEIIKGFQIFNKYSHEIYGDWNGKIFVKIDEQVQLTYEDITFLIQSNGWYNNKNEWYFLC